MNPSFSLSLSLSQEEEEEEVDIISWNYACTLETL